MAAMSRFAGRRLVMDEEVYESEAATNDRNRGIAHLLDGYGAHVLRPRSRYRGLHAAVFGTRQRTGPLGTFSPPLDMAGNSVRGQHITRYLSEALGLNLFASAPTA